MLEKVLVCTSPLAACLSAAIGFYFILGLAVAQDGEMGAFGFLLWPTVISISYAFGSLFWATKLRKKLSSFK